MHYQLSRRAAIISLKKVARLRLSKAADGEEWVQTQIHERGSQQGEGKRERPMASKGAAGNARVEKHA